MLLISYQLSHLPPNNPSKMASAALLHSFTPSLHCRSFLKSNDHNNILVLERRKRSIAFTCQSSTTDDIDGDDMKAHPVYIPVKKPRIQFLVLQWVAVFKPPPQMSSGLTD